MGVRRLYLHQLDSADPKPVWDRLSSEEATLLTAAHLDHPEHPNVPKSSLPLDVSLFPPSEPRPYPVRPLPGTTTENSQGAWAFKDINAATHLIRNSLAGANRMLSRQILSITPPGSRGMRDDITAL